jgi:hypothetical protein
MYWILWFKHVLKQIQNTETIKKQRQEGDANLMMIIINRFPLQ